MAEMERVPTGIEGFDKIVEGGLPKGSLTLLSGTPGTAKSIFALQYIANGAKKYGEKGIYISFEQNKDSLIRQMSRFGYDLQDIIDKKLIQIIELEEGFGAEVDSYSQLIDQEFVTKLKKFGASRIALDSISLVTKLSKSQSSERMAVGELAGLFKYMGATTIFTHERTSSSMGNLEYSIEEFVADGIIHLQLHMTENLLKRYATVIKMRETNQSTGIYEFIINENGIYIRS